MVIILELGIVALQIIFLAFVVTQIFIPMMKGTRTFPMFRNDRTAIHDKLTAAYEARELKALRSELKTVNKENNQ